MSKPHPPSRSGQPLLLTCCAIAGMVFSGTPQAVGDKTEAAASATEDPNRVQDDQQAKIHDLSERFDVLCVETEDALAKLDREYEARESLEKRHRAAMGREREELEVQIEIRREMVAVGFANWARKFSALSSLDRRLSNLKRIVTLRDEIRRLRAQREGKTVELRNVEGKIGVKRSELMQAQILLEIGRAALKGELDPERETSEAVRRLARGAAAQGERKTSVIDEGEVKKQRDFVQKQLAKVDAIRADFRRLRDRTSPLHDEVLEIDVTLWMLSSDLSILEKTRKEWDLDKALFK